MLIKNEEIDIEKSKQAEELDRNLAQDKVQRKKCRPNLFSDTCSSIKSEKRIDDGEINEKQRAAKRERDRLYRLNRSEEKRQSELIKKRQMTKEQRKAIRDRYLNKLTKEKLAEMRRKKAERLKIVRANWSEEKKEAERQRKRAWSVTRRDRTVENRRARLQRQNMTDEERVTLRAKWKEKRRNAAEKRKLLSLDERRFKALSKEQKARKNEKAKLLRLKRREEISKSNPDKYKLSEDPINIERRIRRKIKKEAMMAAINDENSNIELGKHELPSNTVHKNKRKALSANNEEEMNVTQSKSKKKTLPSKQKVDNEKLEPRIPKTESIFTIKNKALIKEQFDCKVVLERTKLPIKIDKKTKKSPMNHEWSVIKPKSKEKSLIIKIAKSRIKQKSTKGKKNESNSSNEMRECNVMLKRLTPKTIELWLKGQAKRVQWKLTPTLCSAKSKPQINTLKCVPLSILIKKEPKKVFIENETAVKEEYFNINSESITTDPLLQDELDNKFNIS